MLEVFGPLFDHYSVDAVATGHIHAYERTQPVTGGLMTGLPDPNGAVHLTVGCGGSGEGLYLYFDPRPDKYPWIGYREAAWGWGELDIQNSTHAVWRWHKLVPRFGSQTGDNVVADSATFTHPPRTAAYLAAAAEAKGAAAGSGCGDTCGAEMRACERSLGCNAVWACMRSHAGATVYGAVCGDDAACAQECFGLGDASGAAEMAALARCSQTCLSASGSGGRVPDGGGH